MSKGGDLTIFMVAKIERSRSLNLLEPQQPLQACSGKPLPFFYSLGEVVFVHVITACRGRDIAASFILKLGVKLRLAVSITPLSIYPRRTSEPPLPTEYEAGWAPDPN